jgi:hypothetical protein
MMLSIENFNGCDVEVGCLTEGHASQYVHEHEAFVRFSGMTLLYGIVFV